jgi:hypothetical protein
MSILAELRDGHIIVRYVARNENNNCNASLDPSGAISSPFLKGRWPTILRLDGTMLYSVALQASRASDTRFHGKPSTSPCRYPVGKVHAVLAAFLCLGRSIVTIEIDA